MEPAYRYRALTHRVIDGDTFEADVDLGFRVFARIKVRLRGFDAPERGEEGWAQARDRLVEVLDHLPLIIESYKDRRSFERWVCDVWVPAVDGGWQLITERLT